MTSFLPDESLRCGQFQVRIVEQFEGFVHVPFRTLVVSDPAAATDVATDTATDGDPNRKT